MLNATVESEISTRIEFKEGGCRHIEFLKDVDISIPSNCFLTKLVVYIKYRCAARKTANINIKNYLSLKRGVYRPDSTYKTAKMIYRKYSHQAEVDSCSIEGNEKSMAYIPAFDRRLHSNL